MSTTLTAVLLDDRFRLGEEIAKSNPGASAGEGALGIRPMIAIKNDRTRVYHAEDIRSGQAVAIKILNRGSAKVAEFRSRFQRDAEIMQSFEHPNVVKTIASGITPEGQPYFAMEFLPGKTLAAKIAHEGPIAPDIMALYLHQIAAAIDAAHSRGIVHRDINPNAIMILDNPTESAAVKLLDFGLAKDLSRPAVSEMEMTGKQTILGKAAYLSPEQARGGEIDFRSDVYALGVTLYEALTGRLPFEGETDFQILLAQINGTVPPFPKKWSTHKGASAIESVVLKALSKAPADRPANAAILANLFLLALNSTPKSKVSAAWPILIAGVVLVTSVFLLGKWLL